MASVASTSSLNESLARVATTKQKVSCRTTKKPFSVALTWTIEDYVNLISNMKTGEHLKSDVFRSCYESGVSWQLYLYPKGRNKGAVDCASVSLGYSSLKHETAMEALIDIAAYGENRLASKPQSWWFTDWEEKMSDAYCIQREKLDLSAGPSKYLANGNLVIRCNVTFFKGVTATVSQSSVVSLNKKSGRSLNSDIAKLFYSMDDSDVTVQVLKQKFQAHKFVLAARSPVFAAMFKNGMAEKSSGIVKIMDVEPNIFQVMLRFMYTDGCPPETEGNDALMKDLLVAADKYQIEALKSICEESLVRSLTVDNCMQLFFLADRLSTTYLREEALEFICLFSAEVMETAGWKDMKKQAGTSHIFSEISERLTALLGPAKKKQRR